MTTCAETISFSDLAAELKTMSAQGRLPKAVCLDYFDTLFSVKSHSEKEHVTVEMECGSGLVKRLQKSSPASAEVMKSIIAKSKDFGTRFIARLRVNFI